MFKLYTLPKTHHFEIKNAKIFCGGGHPLPRPPLGAYGASIFAPTALKINVTPLPPPEKNPSYGLDFVKFRDN